ncbi:hypothetical protein JRQ81_007619 [Phrynocephalus forsythii]|uniref:Uncharacterized protein n=1 Tax=Phrynocephalus forsythii TaxID=171643 RepID=A0A9Q0XDX5_9SAUR|nr:hypothetical protein JRQ81_007619 [Phrynocephalus forsythii]
MGVPRPTVATRPRPGDVPSRSLGRPRWRRDERSGEKRDPPKPPRRLLQAAGSRAQGQNGRGPQPGSVSSSSSSHPCWNHVHIWESRHLSRDKPVGLHSTGEEIRWKEGNYLNSSCSRLLNGAAFSSPGSFSTPKFLHHLQSRIRELRAEKAGYSGGSLDHLSVFCDDLTQTYRSKRHQTPEASSSPLDRKSTWK